MGEPVPAKYPLYGRDAHRTRAGIHADGLNKFWWMYAPFDVPRLLGRPLELSFTKDSGIAGLVFLVKQHTGREPAKDDRELVAVHRELLRQFDAGRQTAVEWEELQAHLPRELARVKRVERLIRCSAQKDVRSTGGEAGGRLLALPVGSRCVVDHPKRWAGGVELQQAGEAVRAEHVRQGLQRARRPRCRPSGRTRAGAGPRSPCRW